MSVGLNYAGSTIRVALSFGEPTIGPGDVASAVVSIIDPTGAAVVTAAPLTWDADALEWFYQWASPSDAGDRTYSLQGVLVGLDASVAQAWGTVEVSLPPFGTIADQPDGVPPASQHWITPWCTEQDIPPGRLLDSNGEALSDVSLGWAICAATSLLFLLGGGSRGRYGRSVVRPSRLADQFGNQSYLYPYSSMSGYGSAWGFAQGWSWSTLGAGWWQSGQDLSQVVLSSPVRRINSVLVDGVELDPSAYTLYDRRRLIRNVDPSGGIGSAWPWNQQLQLPISSPGTWQIDYEWGRLPKAPDMARMAAAELSIELFRAFSGQDATKLPARVTRIATQGTDAGVGDPLEFLRESLTGLPIVDLWLRAANPGGRRRKATFMSPEKVVKRAL